MTGNLGIILFWITIVRVSGQDPVASVGDEFVEEKAAKFVEHAEKELEQLSEKASFIEWNYATNLTDENEQKSLESQVWMVLSTHPIVILVLHSGFTI